MVGSIVANSACIFFCNSIPLWESSEICSFLPNLLILLGFVISYEECLLHLTLWKALCTFIEGLYISLNNSFAAFCLSDKREVLWSCLVVEVTPVWWIRYWSDPSSTLNSIDLCIGLEVSVTALLLKQFWVTLHENLRSQRVFSMIFQWFLLFGFYAFYCRYAVRFLWGCQLNFYKNW